MKTNHLSDLPDDSWQAIPDEAWAEVQEAADVCAALARRGRGVRFRRAGRAGIAAELVGDGLSSPQALTLETVIDPAALADVATA
jgi:hypothetical protein